METLLLPDVSSHSGGHIVGARKGIQLNFTLIEPVVFLQGHSTHSSACKDKAAVVRGSLHMKVTEAIKIKRISVYFRGVVQLELSGVKLVGNKDLITSGITYFDRGQTTQSDNVYGADLCRIPGLSGTDTERDQAVGKTAQTLSRDQSLPPEYNTSSVQQPKVLGTVSKSAIFPAGDYMYSFEFLLHNSLPETIDTDLIRTRYYLEAVVEPTGPFRSKMVSQLDVPVVRLPPENSLEFVEPLIFSRKWREQLYYDVCIFGKCFPLGSQIPMRIRLTPLVNLECRWIRVYVSQNVQYWPKSQTGRVLQLPTKRALLFEKHAGLASYSSYAGSTMRIMTDADKTKPPGNTTGSLLGGESETSEITLEVQLPRCPEMRTKERTQRLHFSTKGGSPEVNHWIQIVLCLSTNEKDGESSSKPRLVELTIESPFTILSCKATPANIYVPPYAVERDMGATAFQEGQCGCGRSPRPISLASRREAEAPETTPTDKSTSVKTQSLGDITQPVSLDSRSSGIKQPARAHLPDWDIPTDEILPRAAAYGSRHWYGG